EAPYGGNSNDTIILIALTSVVGCLALSTIIVIVFVKTIVHKKDKDVEHDFLIPKEHTKRRKVDIRRLTKTLSTPTKAKKKSIQIHKLRMMEDHHDADQKVQKLSLGSLDLDVPTKTILMLGETGVGKSSTINALANYIFGIELNDKERVLLIENKTEYMTAYVLPYQIGMPYSYNYVIIDTPGFGDTRGFERDQQLLHQLKTFLKQDYDINQIDIVGFVVKASVPRLTIAQKYIYDGLFSMFGKDISQNILLLVTFAGPENPPVLEVLNDAGIQYLGYFKINTESLYNETGETGKLTFNNQAKIEFNWNMTENSLQKMFEKMNGISPVNISLTKVVLEDSTRLRSVVGSLQNKIQEGLDKVAQLKLNQIEAARPEETKLIEQDIKHTEELLVNSIKEAQQLTARLKQIPLRLDPLSVHGYIEQLIDIEEKDMQPNYEQRIQVLVKLKQENNVLKAVINKDQSPVETWL
ncbi:unnamed protein product, partial [Meganyctiphanes norvegica]